MLFQTKSTKILPALDRFLKIVNLIDVFEFQSRLLFLLVSPIFPMRILTVASGLLSFTFLPSVTQKVIGKNEPLQLL